MPGHQCVFGFFISNLSSTQKYSQKPAWYCLVASGLQDAIRNDRDVVFRADKQYQAVFQLYFCVGRKECARTQKRVRATKLRNFFKVSSCFVLQRQFERSFVLFDIANHPH